MAPGVTVDLPLATSTPLEQTARPRKLSQVTFEELLDILAVDFSVRHPDDYPGPSNSLRLDAKTRLSLITCYELVFALLTDIYSGPVTAEFLLEAMCFCLESTLKCGKFLDYKDSLIKCTRTLMPALRSFLCHPAHGPWIARIIAVFYSEEGIVPVEVVNHLRRVLNLVSDSPFYIGLRRAVLAALRDLQPYTPNLIPRALFAANSFHFPDYHVKLDGDESSNFTEDISPLNVGETYEKHLHTVNHVGRNDQWYPSAALKRDENFVCLWTELRYPDHPTCLLGNAVLQNAEWLSSTFSSRKRTQNTFPDLLKGGLPDSAHNVEVDFSMESVNIETAREMFRMSKECRNNFHETIPVVASVALEIIRDASSPMELFIIAIENLSLLYIAGKGSHELTPVFGNILEALLDTEDFRTQSSILEAVRRMIEEFERDLPRLWDLEQISDGVHRNETSEACFANYEIANAACYVDTVAVLNAVLKLVDSILWKLLLVSQLDRTQSILVWDATLKIWNIMASISNTEKLSLAPTIIPHPQLIQAGLVHFYPLIRHRVRQFADKFFGNARRNIPHTARWRCLRSLLKESARQARYLLT